MKYTLKEYAKMAKAKVEIRKGCIIKIVEGYTCHGCTKDFRSYTGWKNHFLKFDCTNIWK